MWQLRWDHRQHKIASQQTVLHQNRVLVDLFELLVSCSRWLQQAKGCFQMHWPSFCIQPCLCWCYCPHARGIRENLDLLGRQSNKNICSTSAARAPDSLRNLKRTPNRVMFNSGPLRSTSLWDIPPHSSLELNTTHIWFGFCGWYTLNVVRYQCSLPLSKGGASSAWSRSIIFCMNLILWSFISGLFSRAIYREQRHFKACTLLLRSLHLTERKGKGAIQLFPSFW